MAYQKRRPRLSAAEVNAIYNDWTNKVSAKSLLSMKSIVETLTGNRVDASGMCKCPFHEEKNASMSVTDGKGYHCFKTGCAGEEGGGAISFVMLLHGVDFRTARNTVAEMVGEPAPTLGGSTPVLPRSSTAPVAPAKEALPALVLSESEMSPSSLESVPRSFPMPQPGVWFKIFGHAEEADKKIVPKIYNRLPQMVHPYRGVHGDLKCMVVRTFNTFTQSKQFFQIHAGDAAGDCPPNMQAGGRTWKLGLPDSGERKPVYGAEMIRSWLEIPEEKRGGVLIVEGEKCVDYARKVFNDNRVLLLSPMGGTQGVLYADWAPLLEEMMRAGTKSVRFLSWPDNDSPTTRKTGTVIDGQEIFLQRVANGLKRDAEAISALHGLAVPDMLFLGVRPPPDKGSGWDIADAIDEGWSRERIIGHIRSESFDVTPVPEYVPPVTGMQKGSDEGPREGEDDVGDGPQ